MPQGRKGDFNHSIDFLRFCSNSVLPPDRRLDRGLRQRLRPGDVLEFAGPVSRFSAEPCALLTVRDEPAL